MTTRQRLPRFFLFFFFLAVNGSSSLLLSKSPRPLSSKKDVIDHRMLSQYHGNRGNRGNHGNHGNRWLQNVSDAPFCSLCGNMSLLETYIPFPTLPEYHDWSCGDFGRVAASIPEPADCRAIQAVYPYCCETPPVHECDSRIRSNVLAGYDTAVLPRPSARDRLNVTVSITFFAVTEISVQKGTVEVHVAIVLDWEDPRLTWTVGPDADCSDTVLFRASMDQEQTDIWVPDFDLYNQVKGISGFTGSGAIVNSRGQVTWLRTGPLEAFCQFSGLGKIPFDTLGCQFMFGGWARRGSGQQEYTLAANQGLFYGDFPPTFSEFIINQELSTAGRVLEPDNDWTLYFNFYFERARQYYTTNIIVPTTLLTYLSFGSFLLDLRVGERLSYGISLALVVVAQQIVTAGLLPVTNERLWLERFVSSSFYWILFCLVESVIVGYVYFLDSKEEEEESDAKNNKSMHRLVSLKHLMRTTVKGSTVHEKTRRIDHFCLGFSAISYTIFIIIMFATLHLWDSHENNAWIR